MINKTIKHNLEERNLFNYGGLEKYGIMALSLIFVLAGEMKC
jgi:hypothetical protein